VVKDTLHRWLTENVADTRAADGPKGRVYAAPFARVWDELLAQIARQPGWKLAHKDEVLGMVTVRCRSFLFRFVDDLTLWVALDENALTRVEARSVSRVGRGDLGANHRRIRRLFLSLDRALGLECRLRERRDRARRGPRDASGATA